MSTEPSADVGGLSDAEGRAVEHDWRAALMDLSLDAVVILDARGTVLAMNRAFVERTGCSPENGPFTPPYPWWPTVEEDERARGELEAALAEILACRPVVHGFPLYGPERSVSWVESRGTSIDSPAIGTTHLRVMRDITDERAAHERRAAAAEVSRDFATAQDMGDLISLAEHGFGLLFDGECTVRLGDGADRHWFNAFDVVDPAGLPKAVLDGLDGRVEPDTVSVRPGILLIPPASDIDSRAWVQFARPRRISVEELIAADLMAAAFAAGLQRMSALQKATDTEAHLRQAVESHRQIGQATGILVERHRLSAVKAFDQLRRASQDRNVKLRDLAVRVIETGLEPGDA